VEEDGGKEAVTSVEGEDVPSVAMKVVGREKTAVIAVEAVGSAVAFSPAGLQLLKIAPPINNIKHITFINIFIRHIQDLW
jgi:hypothetical protein